MVQVAHYYVERLQSYTILLFRTMRVIKITVTHSEFEVLSYSSINGIYKIKNT